MASSSPKYAATHTEYRSSEEADPLGARRGRRGEREGGLGLAEDFIKRGSGPAQGMGGGVPQGDEGGDGIGQCPKMREVRVAQAFAGEDTEPLLHLIHPRAMHGGEMEHEPGMVGQPGAGEAAMMDAAVVAHQMDGGDGGGGESVEV